MITFAFYRWLNTLFGARSFKKVTHNGVTYTLVKGDSSKILPILMSQGFIEEWPNNYGGK